MASLPPMSPMKSIALALPLLAAAPALAQCRPFWANAGLGIPTYPESMVLFNDGAGPALFVGVEFHTFQVYRWDGQRWTSLSDTLPTSPIRLLYVDVLDEGAGPGLYALGNLQDGLGGIRYFGSRWTGSAWVDVPAG